MIYLDSAATSLIKPVCVERAALNAMRTMASPGRGGHDPALRAAEEVYACRESAAELFNVDDCSRVVFTMNATHALNIAIRSLARPSMKVLVSGFEHNSVTRPLTVIGADIRVAGAKLYDRDFALNDFSDKLREAQLVVCTHVSNVFGYILPVYEIGALCRSQGVPFIVDASQSAGILDVDFKRLGADFVAMPGHKALFGPQGTGILLCAEGAKPFMHGGSGSDSVLQRMPDYLPDMLEAGTHNVPGIAGLRAGIDYVKQKGLKNISAHENTLLQSMADELRALERVELFYTENGTQSGVLSVRCKDLNCEEAAARLAERGVCVRAGLHCAPFAHRSAGTLDTGTVRFSFSPFVGSEQVKAAASILKQIINSK